MEDHPIHASSSGEDPFATPAGERRADRRLRGRLGAPVTIWTAGVGGDLGGVNGVGDLVGDRGDGDLVGDRPGETIGDRPGETRDPTAVRRVGLTVSSLLIADGEPPEIFGILDPLSDLRELVAETRRFTVNVLIDSAADRRLADRFAGRYPVDPFEDLQVEDSPFGPLIGSAERTSVRCSFLDAQPAGFQELVRGRVDEIALGSDPAGLPPLLYYRGRYRSLAQGQW